MEKHQHYSIKWICKCRLQKAAIVSPIAPRADSRIMISQWETSLQSNAVSHWLGANLESALAPTQMSICGPWYFLPSNTSGAAYGGLPHHVINSFPGVKKLPNPKSETNGKQRITRAMLNTKIISAALILIYALQWVENLRLWYSRYVSMCRGWRPRNSRGREAVYSHEYYAFTLVVV